MPPLVFIASAAVAAGVTVMVWALGSARPAGTTARGNLARDLPAGNLRELMLARSATERAVTPTARALSRVARRLSPAGLVEGLERKIALAGSPPAWPLERALAAKVMLGLFGAITGAATVAVRPGGQSTLLLGLLSVGGFLLPDLLLSGQARRRQASIRVTLPDALDQMTICVEAGLGFEAAMARVARSADGPLNQELRYTLQEMRVGATRADALRRMAERSEIPELRRFVLALVQAEGYGLPIADILRTQAYQVRLARRQRAEEHAGKLPVKLVFPLVLCILPSLFIVILGPAGLRMMEFFGGS